jgi:hypothetical protein
MEYNPNYTNIFYHTTCDLDPEFACTCDSYYGGCYCGGNKEDFIYNYRKVYVRALGSPIPTKPNETDFHIRIYAKSGPYTTCPEYEDSDIVSEFVISNTVDPIDLDRMYSDPIRKYCARLLLMSPSKMIYDRGNFKGTCSPESYYQAFQKLVAGVLTPSKPREQTENAHISLKKKRKRDKFSKKKGGRLR